MVRTFIMAAAVAAMLVLPPPGRASLYHPEDSSLTLSVRPDGTPEALPFDEFKRRLVVSSNIANPGLKTDDRAQIEKRAAAKMARGELSPEETLPLAVDMLRLGTASEGGWGSGPSSASRLDADAALNRLMLLKRQRPNYYVLSTLAHLYAARGDWPDALSHLESAIFDYAPPPPVPGLTPEQQRWQLRIDRDYILPYLRFRQQEAAQKLKPPMESEDVYPLFPPREKGVAFAPMKFVNDVGKYEPGKLAAADKAKLPPDAVAIVQQLLLWFPRDIRLIWLLGEVYAAEGNFEDAKRAMDYCVSEAGQFGNRRLLVEHRTAVTEVVNAQRALEDAKRIAEKKAEEDAFPLSWTKISIYFGIVAIVVVVAVVRSIRRGRPDRCGPGGCH